METLIRVQNEDHVQVGDILEYHFTAFGGTIIGAVQLAIIESRLTKDPKLQLISTSHDGKTIKIKVRVTKQVEQEMQVQQAGFISVAVVTAILLSIFGAVVWLSLEGVYKVSHEVREITESPAGQVAMAGGGTLALAAGIAALLGLFGSKN